MEGERKILKVVFLENGSTDFDEKNIYVVETNKAIPRKKEFSKKIVAKKNF